MAHGVMTGEMSANLKVFTDYHKTLYAASNPSAEDLKRVYF